jgi:hypothetical protein
MSMKKLCVFCEVVVKSMNKSVVDEVALRRGLSAVLLLLFSVLHSICIFMHKLPCKPSNTFMLFRISGSARQTYISHSCSSKG